VLALTGTWMWWKRRSRATAPAEIPAPAAETAAAATARRWIGILVGVATLAGSYAIVAIAFKNWSFTHRLAEFWLVKPFSLALVAFPITGLLAWIAVRWHTRLWIYGSSCLLMGGWYLLLTKILMP
jgi:hypothetical protein